MNTQEYINELKIHLYKLPNDDREDAIAYYFEYLAEAGPDGAEEAMKKLGTPAELAAGIRADQAMQDFEDLEGAGGAAVGKGVRAVWLAGLAAVPRAALAVFVTAIIIVVFFAVMIALFAAGVATVGGGCVGVVSGLWLLHLDAATAVFYLGCGLFLIGGGIFVFRFAIWCSKHLLIAIAKVFNGIRRSRDKRLNRARMEYQDRKHREKQNYKREKKAYKYERKLMRKRNKAERKRDKAERKREKIDRKIEKRMEKAGLERRSATRPMAAQEPMEAAVQEPEAATEPIEVQEPEAATVLMEVHESEAATEPMEATEPMVVHEPEAAPEPMEAAVQEPEAAPEPIEVQEPEAAPKPKKKRNHKEGPNQ